MEVGRMSALAGDVYQAVETVPMEVPTMSDFVKEGDEVRYVSGIPFFNSLCVLHCTGEQGKYLLKQTVENSEAAVDIMVNREGEEEAVEDAEKIVEEYR